MYQNFLFLCDFYPTDHVLVNTKTTIPLRSVNSTRYIPRRFTIPSPSGDSSWKRKKKIELVIWFNVFTFRRKVGWKAYVMNLGFYILFLVMLTTMTILLEEKTHRSSLLNIPRFTIVIMSLFHLLKELFQIWDEVSSG